MRVIVTGALGHVGSRLIRELPGLRPGLEVVMVDSLLTQRYPSLFSLPDGGRYTFVEGDVLQMELGSLIQKGDTVVHLAAITDATRSFELRDEVERINYGGTERVARACAEAGAPLVHLSSTSVYGPQGEVVDESCSADELKPQSPYASTKLREEQLVRELVESEGLRAVTFRFGTICGVSPGMRFHTAVNKFCWQASMGQALTVWETALHQRRPYLSLGDAVRAIWFAHENRLFDGEVYNVVTENLTVDAVVKMIEARVPGTVVEYVSSEIMNQHSYDVLSEKLRRRGFTTCGSIDREVDETLGWLRAAARGRVAG